MAEAKQQQVVAAGGAWKTVKPFVNGGASGMLATCVIQPIDMIKVRTSSHATILDIPVRPRAGEAAGTGYCREIWARTRVPESVVLMELAA
jgi:hypothetical protein